MEAGECFAPLSIFSEKDRLPQVNLDVSDALCLIAILACNNSLFFKFVRRNSEIDHFVPKKGVRILNSKCLPSITFYQDLIRDIAFEAQISKSPVRIFKKSEKIFSKQ